MASSITIEAHRRRFTVKGGPMQPLSTLVADVLAQLKLAGQLRPEDCQLLLRGKPLDLSTPLRFANVGRDKLELRTGREQVLGVQEAPRPAPPAAAATAASAAPTAHAAAPAAPTAMSSAPQPAAPVAPTAVQGPPAAAALPPTAMPSTSATVPSAVQAPAATAAQAVEPSSSAAAQSVDTAAAASAHPSVALFGRRVWVFTRQAEQQAEGAVGGAQADVDDSFYDFTEADLRRAMASQAAQRAKQEGGHLMTGAMREREERRRAEAYGDVPIRLYLPDGATVLQAALPATAPLSELLALARAALAPGAAAGAFLFTTPPRAVLKDLSPSLYAAKLVPAAKVHVAVDAGKAAAGAGGTAEQLLVRPEVLALAEQPPERSAVMHTAAQQQQQPATGAAASGSAVAGGAAGSSRATGAAQVQKGVPKWLKLGGK